MKKVFTNNFNPVFVNPERNEMTLVQQSNESQTFNSSRNIDELSVGISNKLFSQIPDDVFEKLKNIIPQVQQQQIPIVEKCSIQPNIKPVLDEINLLEIEEENLIKEKNNYIAQLAAITEKLKSIHEEINNLKKRRSKTLKKLRDQISINNNINTEVNKRNFNELTSSLQQNVTAESSSENELVGESSNLINNKKHKCSSSGELQKKIENVSKNKIDKVQLADLVSSAENRIELQTQVEENSLKKLLSSEKRTFGIRNSRPARLGSRKKVNENNSAEKNIKTKEDNLKNLEENLNISQQYNNVPKQRQLLKKISQEVESLVPNSLINNKMSNSDIEININNSRSDDYKIKNKDNIANVNGLTADTSSQLINSVNNKQNIASDKMFSSFNSMLIKQEKPQEFGTYQDTSENDMSRIYLKYVDFRVPKIKVEKD